MNEEEFLKGEKPVELMICEIDYPYDGRRMVTLKSKDIGLCEFLGRTTSRHFDRIHVVNAGSVISKKKVKEMIISHITDCRSDCCKKLLKELGLE